MQAAHHVDLATHPTPSAASRVASSPASHPRPGRLALEGGLVLDGELHGGPAPATGELVFTTASTGWGEILTDPSYAGQIVVLTHPMAGNYRIRPSELESERVRARALVVTRLVQPPPGDGVSLTDLLAEGGIPAISGIDTRALTLRLRSGEARRAVVVGSVVQADAAVAAARDSVPWDSVDHVSAVATARPYVVAPEGEVRGRATLIDYGVKRSLLRALTERGFVVSVLPPNAGAAEVRTTRPDLVVLSPGPGDPSRMVPQIAAVRALAAAAVDGGPPILGVCLGHQLLALAAGARTHRMPVGHHGGNHAVLDIAAARVDIGAHNHEVAVLDGPALGAAGYTVSHRDLNDGTVEGMVHASGRIASVQFHPEGAPGPVDAARIFDLATSGATA